MTQFTCKGVKQINNPISFKHLYHSYLSSFFISAGVPNGEFSEILIAKCRSRFYCTWFICWGGYRAGGKGVCGRLMSPAHETQCMREIRLLRGRLPRKEGGLTGMYWFQTRWFLCEFPIGSYVKLSSAVQPSWSEGRTAGYIFGRKPSNNYFIKI